MPELETLSLAKLTDKRAEIRRLATDLQRQISLISMLTGYNTHGNLYINYVGISSKIWEAALSRLRVEDRLGNVVRIGQITIFLNNKSCENQNPSKSVPKRAAT